MNKLNLNGGVYQIRNIASEKCYVGQAINLKNREKRHWNDLKNNKHHNIYLQRSYNKYGKKDFIFEILLYCEKFELTCYEQFFVDKYDKIGLIYNICKECVNSCKGIKASLKARKRMSMAQKGKNHPLYGKHHTDSTKLKISISMSGVNSYKITKKNVVLKIISMLKNSVSAKNISKKLGIGYSIVIKAKNGYYNDIYNLPPTCFPKSLKNRRGGNNIMPKEIILKILYMIDKNMSNKDIAKELPVSISTIQRAKNGFYNDIYNLKNINISEE